MDFGGFDSSIILICKGWDSQAHRELPGKLESSNLSRDNLSREIGRSHPIPLLRSPFGDGDLTSIRRRLRHLGRHLQKTSCGRASATINAHSSKCQTVKVKGCHRIC